MRRLLTYILVPLLVLSSCAVHEWPDIPESVSFRLQLDFETEMTEWHHLYEDKQVIDRGFGITYDNHLESGVIRYIVRAYPLTAKSRAAQIPLREFTFTKDLSEGYDHEMLLDLPSGSYTIMVWADLAEDSESSPIHDAQDFGCISLIGEHSGNNDYRDAFRGTGSITLTAGIMEQEPEILSITMERPLAKLEIITNDVNEFVEKEIRRINTKSDMEQSAEVENSPTKTINIEDYKVVFYYADFMPTAYSLITDRRVSSAQGIFFESTLQKLNDAEASLGFDYVFLNADSSKGDVTQGETTIIAIKIGVFNNEGVQLSISETINVPLKRSCHTIMRGMFLMQESAGGIAISPGFSGDYNMFFPLE